MPIAQYFRKDFLSGVISTDMTADLQTDGFLIKFDIDLLRLMDGGRWLYRLQAEDMRVKVH